MTTREQLYRYSDYELGRLRIHLLNQRDAYKEGHVPDWVEEQLAWVAFEQSLRRSEKTLGVTTPAARAYYRCLEEK